MPDAGPYISAIAPESSAPLPPNARPADPLDWLLVLAAMLVPLVVAWAFSRHDR